MGRPGRVRDRLLRIETGTLTADFSGPADIPSNASWCLRILGSAEHNSRRGYYIRWLDDF